jgi:hypothetical protein
MDALAYERLLKELGFVGAVRRRKVRHPSDPATLYFNVNRNGDVYFTGYGRDRQFIAIELWTEIPAQQRKDDDKKFIALVPAAGREAEALRDFLRRSGKSPELA